MTIGFDELMRLATLAISVLALLWSVSTWLYVRNSSRDEKVDGEIEGLKKSLAKIEGEIGRMPSHDDITRIHERIDDIAKEMSSLSGEFTGAKSTLALIHQYLMNGSRP